MPFFKNLYDRLFIRFLFSLLGFNSPFHKPQWDFTPYFQYKIGSYNPDHYLYFRRAPHFGPYRFELFRKLDEYQAFDLVRFLDFHYQAFNDKKDFLRFLNYETANLLKGRLKRKPSPYRQRLETTMAWIREQETLLLTPTPPISPASPPAPVSPAPASSAPASPAAPASQAPYPELHSFIGTTLTPMLEASMVELTQSHRGKIILNNNHHHLKLIQLLILLKDLNAPGKKPQHLFKNFSTTDLASILYQFEAFRDKKLNTIQQKISDCNAELCPTDPKTEKLLKAMTDFFY